MKIILCENYADYPISLTKTGLKSLSNRRKSWCLALALRWLSNPQSKDMFPLNLESSHNLRQAETFFVNFAHTENYGNSAVPFCQRLLIVDHSQEQERRRERKEQARRHQVQEKEGAMVRREGY